MTMGKLERVAKKTRTVELNTQDPDEVDDPETIEIEIKSPNATKMGDSMTTAQRGNEFESMVDTVYYAIEAADEEVTREEVENLPFDAFMTLTDEVMDLMGMADAAEGNQQMTSMQGMANPSGNQNMDKPSSSELRERLQNQK